MLLTHGPLIRNKTSTLNKSWRHGCLLCWSEPKLDTAFIIHTDTKKNSLRVHIQQIFIEIIEVLHPCSGLCTSAHWIVTQPQSEDKHKGRHWPRWRVSGGRPYLAWHRWAREHHSSSPHLGETEKVVVKAWLHMDTAQLSRWPVKPHIMNSHKMILNTWVHV